ncbi:hypothetical protein JW851_04695 [Candidatus Woesearchaeota archaeon]|nr:hypothetical protein [Candidatus Woesearchaeota archaeon]
MGKDSHLLEIIQKYGFFWECPDKDSLKNIFEKIGFERVRNAAYKHVLVISDILEGKYSSKELRMINILFQKGNDSRCTVDKASEIREKMWNYRLWLMDFFGIVLPETHPWPVFLADDLRLIKSRKFFRRKYREDFEKRIGKDVQNAGGNLYFAGFIIENYE